jgi:hypothetical protein
MNLLGLVQTAAGLIAEVLIVAAAALYLRSVRTAPSISMLVGAAGQLVVNILFYVIIDGLFETLGRNVVDRLLQGLQWAGVISSLVFAISLMVVLRQAVRTPTSAPPA